MSHLEHLPVDKSKWHGYLDAVACRIPNSKFKIHIQIPDLVRKNCKLLHRTGTVDTGVATERNGISPSTISGYSDEADDAHDDSHTHTTIVQFYQTRNPNKLRGWGRWKLLVEQDGQ